jgi:cytochrome c oxidase subunit 4
LVQIGSFDTTLNIAIACAKALLVALVFMRLCTAGVLIRLVCVTGLVLLALLFGLSGTDYATRHQLPAPWSEP